MKREEINAIARELCKQLSEDQALVIMFYDDTEENGFSLAVGDERTMQEAIAGSITESINGDKMLIEIIGKALLLSEAQLESKSIVKG